MFFWKLSFFWVGGGVINKSASLESRMKDKVLQDVWNTDGMANACT